MHAVSPINRRLSVLSLAAAASLVHPRAWAQKRQNAAAQAGDALNWPSKPLRILVGFPPGSVQDLAARAIAEPLSKQLGQPVVVENRAGASGSIAGELVAKASDEHTVGVMNNTTLTVIKMLNPATPFDPAKDFQPIALMGVQPLVLVVNGSASGNSPAQYLEWLRGLGDKASYGSPGTGTPGHLGMELLKGKIGSSALHVPYPGNPQVITALLGGQLHAGLMPPALVMGHIRSGKLKAIGVTSPGRSAQAAELPSMRELGAAKAEMELWTAMAAPKSLPAAYAAKLSQAVVAAVQSAEGRSRLQSVGWQPAASTAEGLAARIKSDTSLLGGIILLRGIKAES